METRAQDNLIQQLQNKTAEIQRDTVSLRERLTVAEQSTKSAHHRLDSMQDQTKAIIKMSANIEHILDVIKDMQGILKEHDARIDKLERLPGDTILKYWQLVVGALLTGAVGVVIGVMLK